MHCARPAICILKNLGLNGEVTFSINQILLLQPEGDEKKEISFGDESSKIGCRFWPKSFRTEGECEIIIIMYL